MDIFGKSWAQPVVRKRWVPITLVLEWFARRTHFKFGVLASAKHHAWMYACDIK